MTEQAFVRVPPSVAPVVLTREICGILARLDVSATAHKVVWALLEHHDPKTGAAELSHADLSALTTAAKPTITEAVRQLIAAHVIIEARRRHYMLHPAIVAGTQADRLRSLPTLAPHSPKALGQPAPEDGVIRLLSPHH